MKYNKDIFDHMMSCMRLWNIHVSADGRFWCSDKTVDGEVGVNHVRSMLRQELMIAYKLSEAQRRNYITSLLNFAVYKAQQLNDGGKTA